MFQGFNVSGFEGFEEFQGFQIVSGIERIVGLLVTLSRSGD